MSHLWDEMSCQWMRWDVKVSEWIQGCPQVNWSKATTPKEMEMVLGELKWGVWLCWMAEQVFGEDFIQTDIGRSERCLPVRAFAFWGMALLVCREEVFCRGSCTSLKLHSGEGKMCLNRSIHEAGQSLLHRLNVLGKWQVGPQRPWAVNVGRQVKSSWWEKDWDEDEAELPTLPWSAVQHLLRILSRWSKKHFDGELEDALLLYCRYNFVQYTLYCIGSAKKWYWEETDGSKQN